MANSRSRALVPPFRTARAALSALALAGAAACSDTFRLGEPGSATAVAHASQVFEAFAIRFAPNTYDPKYGAARIKLGQSALVPSRIFDDTSVWTAGLGTTTHTLLASGTETADGRYRVEARPALAAVSRPGDTRHVISLERVSPNQFHWDTRVDLAVGRITTEEAVAGWNATIGAAEGHTEKELREDYRAAFPRAGAVFGKGFALDSVTITPGALGTTTVVLRFGFYPDQMRASYPALTGYLDKYLGPAKSHFVLADKAGAAMFEVTGRDHWMTFRYRLREGKLVSLAGAPKPLPDTLTLTADMSVKIKIFTVGVRQLVTEFVNVNSASGTSHERGWEVVAQHEPQWELPMLAERLLRAPLHHPFEGAGAMFSLYVRDTPGAETVWGRHSRFDVQESPIMHFLGSLAAHAMGDLDERVEQDEHRFVRDGFVALQADLHALGGRARN